MKWGKSTIGEHCEITSSKRIFYSEYVESGVPFYRSKEIIEKYQGQVISEPLFISRQKFIEIKNKFGVPKSGDLLLTSVGTIGIPYIVKYEDEFYFKDGNLTWFRKFDDQLYAKYLYYWILSTTGKGVLLNSVIGSSQKALTIAALKAISLSLPPIEMQKRIADILSAYDDLIENNQKQIKLLEEAAQRLYKEWFINLHFPGYKTSPIVNGIPEGWERKTIEKCLIMSIGGGWGKDEPRGTYLYKGRVIRGTDIPDVYYGNYRDVPLRYHTEKDIRTRSLQENDIVFELSNGNIDNIGRCLLIDKEMLRACDGNTICASFCKLLRPINEAYSLLLFLEIQAMQYNGTMLPLKKHGANGINNFDFQGFLQHDILVPNDMKLLDSIKAIVAKISILRKQLRLLTEARGRLLPKLMSGEIEVR